MKRLIKPAAYALIVLVVVAFGVRYWKQRKAADGKPTFQTVTVERRDVELTVSATGVLEPLTTVDVKANVGGEIVQLAVDRGDYVHGGDLIARIDPTEAQSSYDQAQADLRAAMGKVRETSASLDRDRELSPAQVKAARESVRTAELRVEEADKALAYQKRSTEAGIRRAQEALAAAKAQREQAEERAERQPTLTETSIQQAQADLEAANESLVRLREATQPRERAEAKSTLEAARVALDTERKSLQRLRSLCEKGFVAQQEVDDGQARVAASQDALDRAQATWDALEQTHSTQLREAQAQVRRAQAALTSAKTGDSDVRLAQQELKAAQASVREAEASLAAAQAARDQDAVREKELESARSQLKETTAQLDVTEANAQQPRISVHQVSQAEAQSDRSRAELENATKNLAYTTIAAPRDGLVIDRYVEQGTVISSSRSSFGGEGQPVVTIADMTRLFVNAEVDEADIGRVQVGQKAEIEVDTFPDEVFHGRVTQVYPRGEDVENITIFRVRIEVEDPDEALRPEMTAEASVLVDRRQGVLAVPSKALVERAGQRFARVPDKTGALQPVPVEVGLESLDYTEIVSGLSEGQEIALTGSTGPLPMDDRPPGGGPPPQAMLRR
jgi:HlyD family secretion protein